MSDPVLALVLLAAFFATMAVVRFFKSVDADLGHGLRLPLITGIAAGVILLVTRSWAVFVPPVAGILLTIAAAFVRRSGDESEAADGMILGSLTGAFAALPLALFSGDHELRWFSQMVLGGAVAGYGVTYAAFHAADRARQIAIDAVSGVAAVAAAYVPSLLDRIVPERDVAIATAAAVPLATIVVVFHQWADVRRELSHEASLGFMADSDVAPTAHPFRRLGRGGWIDKHAHREFVRLALRIALRKRRQHERDEESARLYQLEIMKLRMQLQEMKAIDRAARAAAEGTEVPSDKMPA